MKKMPNIQKNGKDFYSYNENRCEKMSIFASDNTKNRHTT